MSSTDPRLFSLLDEFDDFPYDPSLRIPPLQDPIPFPFSSRPSPLEPSARVSDGIHNATAKLTSRRKALAEAKAIGEIDTNPRLDSGVKPVSEQKSRSGGDAPTARKRQKTAGTYEQIIEFVQLPKPTAKVKTGQPPPFELVPILNELHEPPPSAALFPPINPYESQDDQRRHIVNSIQQPPVPISQSTDSEVQPPRSRSKKTDERPLKRVSLRIRRKWTDEETDDLLEGVAIYGIGKWKKILNHSEFSFHPERTAVDLKDRYRTCRMNEEKALDRTSSGQASNLKTFDSAPDLTSDTSPSVGKSQSGIESTQTAPSPTQTIRCRLLTAKSTSPAPQNHRELHLHIERPSSFDDDRQNSPSHRRRISEAQAPIPFNKPKSQPPRWTKEEDAHLARGYCKYGFSWTAIAKDPEMHLERRTGPQVRDRFRLKFPIVYQSPVPIPLPETPEQDSKPIPRSISQSSPQEKTSLSIMTSPKLVARPPPPLTPTPQPYKPPESEQEASPEPELDRELEVHPHTQDIPQIIPNFPDERSRQSSTAAEETRHSGILGLLNEEDEEVSRLPSFKYPYDDWGGDSVTLPPLLWEDMATRPMFDLE